MTNRPPGGRSERRKLLLVVVVAVMLLALLSGCTSSNEKNAPDETTGFSETTEVTTAAVAPAGDLTVDHFNDGVYCDGTERPAVIVLGATPGETITFQSAMPVEIASSVADSRGAYQLLWSCEDNEASLFWDITATGTTSNRTVTFRVDGSYQDPDAARSMIFNAAPDPLTCNGTGQIVGELTEAEPNETIEFTAIGSNVGSIQGGVADGKGSLLVNWSCKPEDADDTWTIRAAAQSSGRVAEFSFAALAPEPLDEGPILVALIEDPFVCNRDRRPLATMTNLTPLATVTFDSTPSAGTLRPGQASSNGELTVYWQCHRNDAELQWSLKATESGISRGEPREVTFSFSGASTDNPTTITVTEDPFICDGTSREFAILSNFISGEFVDFTSPQTETIRQGQAADDGKLPIRWQCDAAQVGSSWDVTATGKTSGLSLTFTITSGAP